jgi:hypothetical protein
VHLLKQRLKVYISTSEWEQREAQQFVTLHIEGKRESKIGCISWNPKKLIQTHFKTVGMKPKQRHWSPELTVVLGAQ